jgi:hypothetical protein
VRIVYEPQSLRTGAAVSALTLAVIGLAAVAVRRRHRLPHGTV